MQHSGKPSLLNLPNALTTLRLCSVPVLLWLAWQGESVFFVCVLVGSLLTDLIDGLLARWLKQASEFGTRYDTVADASLFLALPVCVYWLKPEFMRQEAVFFWMVIACFAVPLALSLLRFGRLPSLHTLGNKCSAVLLGAAIIIVFLDGSYLPFRIAAVVHLLASIEESTIILVLPKWRSNVPSLRHALTWRKRDPSEGS